jgi:transposase
VACRGDCSRHETAAPKEARYGEEALLKLLHRWRNETGQGGRQIKRIVVAYEAGRDGFWLARWLRARDVEAYVIHPTSIAVSREHRRAKSDRLDTELLMRAFLGWLRGEKRHCSMVAIPTAEEEDARRPNRERGLRKLAAVPAGEIGPHAMVRLIARVLGVGVETADMLVNEILSRRLRDHRAIARYAGLTGSPDESGRRRRERGLARAGNARVRCGMIQLAWRFLRFQKDSALAQWFQARTADGRAAHARR